VTAEQVRKIGVRHDNVAVDLSAIAWAVSGLEVVRIVRKREMKEKKLWLKEWKKVKNRTGSHQQL
jgi:hypothetical protein